MDLVLGLARKCVERLLLCKEMYNDLTTELNLLTVTVSNVSKLHADRANEQRLHGAIQESMAMQLRELHTLLDTILEQRSTRGGRAAQFFGTCVGRGAKSYRRELQVCNESLRATLSVADSEVLVAAASAAEELAGGAAGKHIAHPAARRFWREHFKNEMEVPVGRFWSAFDELRPVLRRMWGPLEKSVILGMTGRLDTNLDSVITAQEFGAFVKDSTAALTSRASMLSLLQASALPGGPIVASTVASHLEAISTIDSAGCFVATADVGGCLKIWSMARFITPVATVLIGRARHNPIMYCRFSRLRERLVLLIATLTSVVVLDPFSGKLLSSLVAPHSSPITSVTGEGEFLFSTARFPSRFLSVWRLDDKDRLYKWGVIGGHEYDSSYAEPIGDFRHVCIVSQEARNVTVFDYIALQRIHQLVLSPDSLPVYVRGFPGGGASVGYLKSDREDFWPKAAVCPTPESSSSVGGRARRTGVLSKFFPRTHVSQTFAATVIGKSIVQISFRVPNQAKDTAITVKLLPAMTVEAVHSCDDGVVARGLLDSMPCLVLLRPSKAVLTGGTAASAVRGTPTTAPGPAAGTSADGAGPAMQVVPMLVMSNSRHISGRRFTASSYRSIGEQHHATALLFSNSSGKHDGRHHGGGGKPQCFLFSACSSHVVSLFTDSLECLYSQSLRFGKKESLPGAISGIVLCRNNRSIVVTTSLGKIVRYDFPSEEEVQIARPSTFAEIVASSLTGFKREAIAIADVWSTEVATRLEERVTDLEPSALPLAAGLMQLLRDNDATDPSGALLNQLRDEVQAIPDTVEGVSAVVKDESARPDMGHAARTEAWTRFCQVDSWIGGASTVLFDSNPRCPGCHALLRHYPYEVVYRMCITCASRRDNPDRCAHCEVAPSNGMVLCVACFIAGEKRGVCAIEHVAVCGDTLLVASGVASQIHPGDTLGRLFTFPLATLVVEGRVESGCLLGYNNLAATDLCGGLFAAATAHHTVSLYMSDTDDERARRGRVSIVECCVAALHTGAASPLCVAFGASLKKAAKGVPQRAVSPGERDAAIRQQSHRWTVGRQECSLMIGDTAGVVSIFSVATEAPTNTNSNSNTCEITGASRVILPTASVTLLISVVTGFVRVSAVALGAHDTLVAGTPLGEVAVCRAVWKPDLVATPSLAGKPDWDKEVSNDSFIGSATHVALRGTIVAPFLTLRGHQESPIRALYFSPCDLMSVSDDGVVARWPLSALAGRTTEEESPNPVVFLTRCYTDDSFLRRHQTILALDSVAFQWRVASSEQESGFTTARSQLDQNNADRNNQSQPASELKGDSARGGESVGEGYNISDSSESTYFPLEDASAALEPLLSGEALDLRWKSAVRLFRVARCRRSGSGSGGSQGVVPRLPLPMPLAPQGNITDGEDAQAASSAFPVSTASVDYQAGLTATWGDMIVPFDAPGELAVDGPATAASSSAVAPPAATLEAARNAARLAPLELRDVTEGASQRAGLLRTRQLIAALSFAAVHRGRFATAPQPVRSATPIVLDFPGLQATVSEMYKALQPQPAAAAAAAAARSTAMAASGVSLFLWLHFVTPPARRLGLTAVSANTAHDTADAAAVVAAAIAADARTSADSSFSGHPCVPALCAPGNPEVLCRRRPITEDRSNMGVLIELPLPPSGLAGDQLALVFSSTGTSEETATLAVPALKALKWQGAAPWQLPCAYVGVTTTELP